MSTRYWQLGAPLLALVLAASSMPAASVQQDDGWLAWQGCWRPDGDTTDVRLCIVPAGEGVRIVTLGAGKIQSESRLIADGKSYPVDQEGCKGTERATWSADRQRVFVRSDLTCGTNITRQVTGIFALTSTRSWVSVQGVTSGDATGTRLVRYVETQPATLPNDIAETYRNNRLARETARYSAVSLLDLADVREALANADARVVESWLTAVGQPFDLDGKKLIELADAGVPSSTIDVLVAVSHPDHFAVNDEPNEVELRETRRIRGVSCWDAGYGSWYDPFGYRYGGYGYGCYPGYSRVGWGYGGYYGWRYSPVVIIDRGREGRGGKVSKAGYSSGRSGSGTAKSRGGDSSSGGASVARPSSGSSSSGSASGSSAGSSSGGSSSGSGEKAKKRD